jgi:hypothetical protein
MTSRSVQDEPNILHGYLCQAFAVQFRRMVEFEKKIEEERKRHDKCQQILIKSKLAEKQVLALDHYNGDNS